MRNWVLGHFSSEDRNDIPDLLDKAAEAALIWAEEGIEKAMNAVNVKSKV